VYMFSQQNKIRLATAQNKKKDIEVQYTVVLMDYVQRPHPCPSHKARM